MNYYTNISESFIELRDYLNNSINKIDNELNQCANITYSTFSDKYINISKEVESINSEDSKIEEEETKDSIPISNQNKIINVNYTINEMLKKVKFKFDLIFEESEIKKPRVKVNIINQSKPNKINFDLIETQTNGCGRIVELVEASFNNVNYSNNFSYMYWSRISFCLFFYRYF